MTVASGSSVAEMVSAGLDPGIEPYVRALQAEGVETYESCQGGPGHACPDPTIFFHGDSYEGYRAFAAAMRVALPVMGLQRYWQVINGELSGPYWFMTFRRAADSDRTGGAHPSQHDGSAAQCCCPRCSCCCRGTRSDRSGGSSGTQQPSPSVDLLGREDLEAKGFRSRRVA